MRKILDIGTFGLAGALFGGKKKPKPVETAAAPAVMPTPDDEKIRLARKRSIVTQLGRKGRESTMLSGDRLGG